MNMTPTSPKDATKIENAIEKWTAPVGNLFVSLSSHRFIWNWRRYGMVSSRRIPRNGEQRLSLH